MMFKGTTSFKNAGEGGLKRSDSVVGGKGTQRHLVKPLAPEETNVLPRSVGTK